MQYTLAAMSKRNLFGRFYFAVLVFDFLEVYAIIA